MMIDANAWANLREQLKALVGPDIYFSWFQRLEFVSFDGRAVHLSVPTRFLRAWIQQHYHERLTELWNSVAAGVEVDIVLRQPAVTQPPVIRRPAPVEVPLPAPISKPQPAPSELRSPVDPRMTFASYKTGICNRLAAAAGQKVATSAGPAIFNPLFIHGAPGLGKTHLLQAMANGATPERVVYLSAERFMFGFVTALKDGTADQFRLALRDADLLLIDDLQFLQGKSMQQEFCHTLNALMDFGRQVVLTADRPPADLDAFEDRVRSRLAGGLVVEIEPFDDVLALEILAARVDVLAAAEGFSVPHDIMAFIVSRCGKSGRDLEGAANRLFAHSQITGAPISLDIAEGLLRDMLRQHEPRRVRIEEVLQIVSRRFNVTRADILSQRRTANVVKPRQIAMYLAKTLTLRSLPEIGRRFGGRDHTTVLHAVRKIEGLRHDDHQLAVDLAALTAEIAGEVQS